MLRKRCCHTIPSTPSLPQPVNVPGWKIHGSACKEYISGPIASTFNVLHFYDYSSTCQCNNNNNNNKNRRRRKGLRVWNFALLLVVFKWHHGSEGVKHSHCGIHSKLTKHLQEFFGWLVLGISSCYCRKERQINIDPWGKYCARVRKTTRKSDRSVLTVRWISFDRLCFAVGPLTLNWLCEHTLYMMVSWCLASSDVSWHIRDKLWPMPKHGSVTLYVHGNQKAR